MYKDEDEMTSEEEMEEDLPNEGSISAFSLGGILILIIDLACMCGLASSPNHDGFGPTAIALPVIVLLFGILLLKERSDIRRSLEKDLHVTKRTPRYDPVYNREFREGPGEQHLHRRKLKKSEILLKLIEADDHWRGKEPGCIIMGLLLCAPFLFAGDKWYWVVIPQIVVFTAIIELMYYRLRICIKQKELIGEIIEERKALQASGNAPSDQASHS